MNKCFFIVLFCTFVNVSAFSDEVLFKPTKDSVHYYDHHHLDRILGLVPDGLYKGDMFLAKTMYIILDGDGVVVKPEDFQSVNTKDVFPSELIRNREDETQKIWWPAFYFEALQKKDRTIIFEKVKDMIYRYKIWDAWYDISESEVPEKWHMYYLLDEGIEFYQHGLRIFEFGLFIDSIEKTETGFVVTVLGDRTYEYENLKHTFIPWPADGKDHFFKLLMEFDGDFLTVYLNNRNTVFLELVRVDKSMADLLYGVIGGSQVTFNDTTPWPRRADKQIEAGKTYRTAEVLRLRTSEGRDSELITEMAVNTVVHVLETGVKDTIDNITANWVQVRLDNETEGWCFGGYLLPDVPVESVAARQDNDGQEVAAIESQPQTAFPFSILIAVAGGAVILAVIVVILIRRKR